MGSDVWWVVFISGLVAFLVTLPWSLWSDAGRKLRKWGGE